MDLCRALRVFLLACLCWTGVAHAGETGREVLRNGAVFSWEIADAPDPRLGLAVPAFAQWGPEGFADPVAIRMTASTLASIDAWQLSFHRAGDVRFERPLRRFRGSALTLHDPLAWNGGVERGPPLRPGETVLAVLEARDAAGNIDRAAPQEMLVARYVMKRERRRIRALDAARGADVERGALPVPRAIPATGRSVALRLENWPEDDAPLLSGLPLRPDGSAWVARQTLPGGIHDLAVQVARPIIGGIRAIPVGIVRLVVPTGPPLLARVKGTGALDRRDLSGAVPDGLRADGAIDGADAARLVLLDRQVGEDRLALALVDPGRNTDLAKDRRKRRSLVSPVDSATALWAGQGAPPSAPRAPPDVRTRSVSVRFDGPVGGELVLHHTDIVRGSLRIERGDGGSLSPVRDFFANPAQGRILLTERALAATVAEQNGGLRVRYEVPVFVPRLSRPDAIVDGGRAHDTIWASTALDRYGAPPQVREKEGLIGKVLDWFVGFR